MIKKSSRFVNYLKVVAFLYWVKLPISFAPFQSQILLLLNFLHLFCICLKIMYLSCLKILLWQFWMIFKRIKFFGSTKNIHCHLKDPLLWNINNSPYQSCSKKICSTDFTVGFFEHLEKKNSSNATLKNSNNKTTTRIFFQGFHPPVAIK